MEATLQLLVQTFVFFVFFPGKRSMSPSVLFSAATSFTMITIAAAKALIPQRLQNSPKESLMTLFRKVAWVITVNILLFATLTLIFELSIAALSVLFFGIKLPAFFNAPSELEINISIAMQVFLMIYIICACLLIKFNCLRKFQQVEPKSLLISIGYFISAIVRGYYLIYASKFLTSFKTGIYFSLICDSSFYLCFLCLTFFFGVATFSIEKFTDIWDIDKFNSKYVISCPRLTSLICFTLGVTASQLGIVMLLPSLFPELFPKW